MNTFSIENQSHNFHIELSKTFDTGLMEESQGGTQIMCEKHPDKEIEGYWRKDQTLLWIKCILDKKNHKQYDYISISGAYKEQQ